MTEFEPIFVECAGEFEGVIARIERELEAEDLACEPELSVGIFAALAEVEYLAASAGELGLSSGSVRFAASAPGQESIVVDVPELGSWQDATEEVAERFGGRAIAWRLTEEGASVTLATRGGERLVVAVREVA